MIRFILLALFALLPSLATAEVWVGFGYEPEEALYARFYPESGTPVAIAFTPGGAGATRSYTISKATFTAAGLSDATAYPFSVFKGSPSISASDEEVGFGVTGVAANVDLSIVTNLLNPMKTVTDKLGTMLTPAGGGNSKFTPIALVEAPAGEGGSGAVVPVNQIAVPISRTWVLTTTVKGLVNYSTLTTRVSTTPQLYAIDFREDLPTNGRVESIESVEVLKGDPDGLSFELSDPDKAGVDKSVAKLKIAALAPGNYELDVEVKYAAASGGGEPKGKVRLIVLP